MIEIQLIRKWSHSSIALISTTYPFGQRTGINLISKHLDIYSISSRSFINPLTQQQGVNKFAVDDATWRPLATALHLGGHFRLSVFIDFIWTGKTPVGWLAALYTTVKDDLKLRKVEMQTHLSYIYKVVVNIVFVQWHDFLKLPSYSSWIICRYTTIF